MENLECTCLPKKLLYAFLAFFFAFLFVPLFGYIVNM